MDSTQKQKLRVVIVGGSIAGLTLAHCLSKSDSIDYVVLESHTEIDPQIGASIGLLPNGGRILDQLGLFDEVFKLVEPLQETFIWTVDGKRILHDEAPRILHERHGYPVSFLDRQLLLRILFTRLGEAQSRVHVNKRVVKVEQRPQSVLVHCADGSVFEGDLVVGADGVRSVVRGEMWRHMGEQLGLERQVEKERNVMTSEYSCVFGISTATSGLNPGTFHRTFATGYSFMIIVGKEGRVFWFLFARFGRQYTMDDLPRFNQEDMESHIAKYLKLNIAGTIPFSAVYANAVSKSFVPLEEAFYEHWSSGRSVCIGDSIHKMTPNLGQGGNSAIESAALLANHLNRLAETRKTISPQDIEACLREWSVARKPGSHTVWRSAKELTRIEAGETLKDRVIGYYVVPLLSKYLLDKISAGIVRAEKLDYVPLPSRSLACTMPWQAPDHSASSKELVKKGVLGVSSLALFMMIHFKWRSF
ncbi:hypothetical protein BJX63DRAFT_415332 [Aspergillus granulosus]|uniref:FAD-binding domain-containing protein n=1 Tax=Aspergillus granulosus TaxID=176169 RepID=A0ABR4GTD8_9EURO